ncbi:bifunctional diguanylate cyclase/phosphodiesterase [Paenisporosarcina sp. TG20]|uniref:sensor domain-containing protein n=1 Tax=Paenisporosarcina sp. TG20 TaxID=1211706 RepID=UPI0002D43407|nr:bifunctional diguanylate cyclase/phosphodiesterase [Paenisporosarcina sp. TG20]
MLNGKNLEQGFVSDLKKSQKIDLFYRQMFDVLVQNSHISMYILKGTSFSYVNNHFCNLTGYTEEELLVGGITIDNIIHPSDLSFVRERIMKKNNNQETDSRYRVRVNKKDGKLLHVEINSTKTIRNGEAVLFGTVFDVTEEVTASNLLKDNQERFKSLFYNNPDGIFALDMEGLFTEINPACEMLTGYSTHELINTSFAPLVLSEELPKAVRNFEIAKQGIATKYEISVIRRDGKRRNLEISNFPKKLDDEIIGVYGIAKDITEKNEQKKLMEELVFFDSLTKLPNRKLFEIRLEKVLLLSTENESKTTVLFLDLDRFKYINDSLGHYLGDEFLKIVSQRLTENVEETDTVGRFGGDEFAILIPNSDYQKVVKMAEQLNQALAEPFDIMGHSLTVSASIGIAFSSGSVESVDGLIKKADTAMYYTKKYGKNNYTFYSDEMEQKNAYKLKIEKGLKSAIQNQELVLYYQPITLLKTGEISGMEALIRWKHPDLGLVPPDNFIPISEESGQIISIGKWVLHSACSQNKEWQNLGYSPFKICVNISAIQLQNKNFVEMVKTVLQETGLDSMWLELEITESTLMEDTKTLKDNLLNLKKLGLSMSIDDFGTGYTSLSYLRQFSFDKVKIDRSFVSDIGNNLQGKAITSTIISLAHKLGMGVVAEGIEDEMQLSFLNEEDCDEGQGYYFSHPLPADLHELSHNTKKY